MRPLEAVYESKGAVSCPLFRRQNVAASWLSSFGLCDDRRGRRLWKRPSLPESLQTKNLVRATKALPIGVTKMFQLRFDHLPSCIN